MRTLAGISIALSLLQTPLLGQVNLSYQVKAGAKQVYEVSQFSEMLATGYDQKYDTGLVLSVTTGQPDTDGRLSRTMRIDQLRQTYNHISPGLPKATLAFDSALNLAQTDAPDNLGHLLVIDKALVGAEYEFQVDREKGFLSAKGSDALHHAILPKFPNRTRPLVKRWLELHLTDEIALKGYEVLSGRFPAKEVKPGEAWEQESDVNLYFVGPLIHVERRYEYVGPEMLDGRSLEKVIWKEIKVPRTEPKILESKGTLYFDRNTGIEVQSHHLLHIRYQRHEQQWAERRIETRWQLKKTERWIH